MMCSCQLSSRLSTLKLNALQPVLAQAIGTRCFYSAIINQDSKNYVKKVWRKEGSKKITQPSSYLIFRQSRYLSRFHSDQSIDKHDEDKEESKEFPTPFDEDYGEYTSGGSGGEGGFENEHMVKLTPLQRAIITVGSGLSAFFDPTKAENIATFGEISAGPVLRSLYQKMLEDPEGYRILKQKPRINSKTVDLEYLSKLPEGTLGWAYVEFLRKNNVTPDSRLPVRFIEDPELAYVMQRYREVHDLVHTVTGQPTNMLGEVVVKWIEGIQTGLPMCVTGGLFGATRLRPKQRQRYLNTHLKWAIDVGFTSKPFLFIFYEERWEERLEDLQFYICPKLLTPPPEKL